MNGEHGMRSSRARILASSTSRTPCAMPLVAATTLDIFNKHCDRVRMANIAQTVNVLQAMILTDKEKMLLTPTYHVFEMYAVHQDATMVPIDVQSEEYSLGDYTVPAMSASASVDARGQAAH